MRKTTGSFLAGLIIGAFVFGSSIAYAWTESITVDFLPLNYFFNGVQKYPAGDQQGFIYNGKTYVPLRFMAEASGLSVDWDGNTNSIYVRSVGSNTSSNNVGGKYMSDILEPYYKELDICNINEVVKVSGQTYYKNYCFWFNLSNYYGKASFNLSGQYSSITGLIGLSDEYNFPYDSTVIIYGDDNILKTYEIKAGSLPQNLDLNVSGVSKLDIVIDYPDWGGNPNMVVLCDPIIK